MRKILILIVALFCLGSASAQVKFGIKGGLNANFNKWNFQEIIQQFDVTKAGNSAGFHVGLQLRIQTKIGLYFEGDALYNYASEKVNIWDNGVNTSSIKISNHNLDIPVLVGFKFGFFRLYAGPKFTVNLGNDIGKSLTDITNIHFKYDSNAFGYQAGVGFDILKKITLDVSYNGRFYRSTQEFIINGNPIEGKFANNQLWISAGFLF